MAPPTRQKSLAKQPFISAFQRLRTHPYTDNARAVPTHYVKTLSWNEPGTLIATGAQDRTVRIWNPERTNVKFSTELKGHSGPIERVAFHPRNEHELATVTTDGMLKLWDVRTKRSVGEAKLGEKPNTLAWRPGGSDLVVGDWTVPRANLSAGYQFKSDADPDAKVLDCKFMWDGDHVIQAQSDGKLKILHFPSFEKLVDYDAHSSSCEVKSVALSPSGEYIAEGGEDGIVGLWSTQHGWCARTLDKAESTVTSVDFSFDGSYLAVGTEKDRELWIAHAETGEYVYSIKLSTPATCVAWHPCRYILAYSAGNLGLKIVGGVP